MSTIAQNNKVFDDTAQMIDGLMEAVANEAFTRIYNRTPVDTGFAQSRWTMTVSERDFLITNDAPYISYLENGWSQQAPNGMVALTMNEIPQIIEEQSRRLRK